MRTSCLLGLMLACGTAAALDEPTDTYRPLEAVLQLRPGVNVDAVNARYGFTTLAALPEFDLYLVRTSVQWTEEQIDDIRRDDDDVYHADLNYTPRDEIPDPGTQDFFLSSDKFLAAQQVMVYTVGAPWANTVATGAGVTVAVIDTGIDATHPAFVGAIAPGGIDFVDGDNTPDDAATGADTDGDGQPDEMVGHGTFAAGVVRLIAPGASILPIRVLDSDGVGSVFAVAAAIYYAADQGARVINLSLGTLAEPDVIEEAMGFANMRGAIVVAAAGNDGDEQVARFPAALAGAVAVAAVDDADVRAPFSNVGTRVDLSAPGVSIHAPAPGDRYGVASGTSWAAPVVAATAALVIEQNPAWSPTEVRSRLLATATPIDGLNPGLGGLLGAGRIDAAAAVGAPACKNPADVDRSGAIDTNDFFAFLSAYAAQDLVADFAPDGTINTNDFFAFLGEYQLGC